MGILGITNRSENWKTVEHFYGLNDYAKVKLVERLSGQKVSSSDDIRIELFWHGMRDHLKKEGRSISGLFDCFASIYLKHFCHLREEIKQFTGLKIDKDCNYDVSEPYRIKLSGRDSDKLSNNLFYTEIDIVIQTPNYLIIGEAKGESSLSAKSDYVLVHQLIRQYVMATILIELSASTQNYTKKEIVPFIVADNVAELNRKRQVKFMCKKGWINEKNVLSWDCIDRIVKPGADYS